MTRSATIRRNIRSQAGAESTQAGGIAPAINQPMDDHLLAALLQQPEVAEAHAGRRRGDPETFN